MMMNQQKMQLMELSMIPAYGSAVNLDDRMLLMDNLDENADPANWQQELSARLPMKLNLTCMVIVIRGKVTMGVTFRDIVAGENTCAIISSGAIIEWFKVDKGTKLIFLSFSRNTSGTLGNVNLKDLHRLYALQAVLLHLQPVHVRLMMTTCNTLRTIVTDPAFDVNREEAAVNCINLLGSILAQGANSQPEVVSKASRRDEIVARFLQCVYENYRQRRDLGFYADKLCLSLKYMSHVVYEQTGRHPSRWIKDYVILDAKTMLRTGRYTIQQVADELNFPNQSFFGKYFKEAVGVSPKKWR